MRSHVGTVFTEHRAARDPKLYQPITNDLGCQRHAIEPIAHFGGLIAAGAILTLSRPQPARGSTYARPGRADGAAPGVDLRRRGRAEGQNALLHALRCRLTFQAQTQWLHGTAVGVIGYQNLVKDP